MKSRRAEISTAERNSETATSWRETYITPGRYARLYPRSGEAFSDPKTHTECGYVLPEDQQGMVEDVKELAPHYGFGVEVVDLAKKNALSRFSLEHREKIKSFPALVTDSGDIIEGILTREEIEAFLFRTSRTRAPTTNHHNPSPTV